MSENRGRDSLRKYVINNMENTWGFHCHISIVESHDTSPGIPDLDICINGIEARMELKFSRENNKFTLRPTQVAWFRRRNKAKGSRNFILWCQEIAGDRYFHIIPGKKVPHLGKRSYDQDRAMVSKTWDGKIDWPEFLKCLEEMQ